MHANEAKKLTQQACTVYNNSVANCTESVLQHIFELIKKSCSDRKSTCYVYINNILISDLKMQEDRLFFESIYNEVKRKLKSDYEYKLINTTYTREVNISWE